MLKLKLQSFGHLMWRTNSLEKTLMLGKFEGRRRSWWQRMSWLSCITNLMDMSLSKLWELLKDREPCDAAVHGGWQRVAHNWVTEKKKQLGTIHRRFWRENLREKYEGIPFWEEWGERRKGRAKNNVFKAISCSSDLIPVRCKTCLRQEMTVCIDFSLYHIPEWI